MSRQSISLEAERTDPYLGADVDVAEGVEDGLAGGATDDGVILQRRVRQRFERRQACAYWNDESRCLL